jgi:hypothetical protein
VTSLALSLPHHLGHAFCSLCSFQLDVLLSWSEICKGVSQQAL